VVYSNQRTGRAIQDPKGLSTMSAFESPNYTQAPNDLFEMMPDMSDCELRVTLIMVRQTFGYHRDGFKMGIKKMAKATGLSEQGVRNGAEQAEKRGTFNRSNPTALGEAEWELAVDPLNMVDPHLNVVDHDPQRSRPQVGVKESIKKHLNKENDDDVKPAIDDRLAKLSTLYQSTIGLIPSGIMPDILRNAAIDYPEEWFEKAFEVAVVNNVRKWSYIEAILDGWKRNGFGWKPESTKGKTYATNQPRAKETIYGKPPSAADLESARLIEELRLSNMQRDRVLE
jgi:DnaD/phage-associated family protein